MTDSAQQFRDNVDKLLTTRQELREQGILPPNKVDGCCEAVAVDDRADAAVFLNDELQRSLQALAERCAGQYRMRVEADRARWRAEDRIRQLVKTLEWFTRYLPQDPTDDGIEDRIAREVLHYAVTGVELTVFGDDDPSVASPEPSAASPDLGGVSAAEMVFQALGAASVAWNPRPTGVFDSTWAKKVGETLLENLGLSDGEGSDRD